MSAAHCMFCGERLEGVDCDVGTCWRCYTTVENERVTKQFYEELWQTFMEEEHEEYLKQLEDASRDNQES